MHGLIKASKALSDEVRTRMMKLLLEKDKLLDEVKDLDVEEVFGKRIGCHACSKVCPVCYCQLCFVDSPTSEHGASDYERELGKSGSVRVPLDTIFDHLVRLFHVSLSCAGCGKCNEVCLVNIPFGAMAVRTAGAVQEAFDYAVGKNIEEELPITTFKPEEFAGVE